MRAQEKRAQHTPGPWRVAGGANGYWFVEASTPERRNYRIASVPVDGDQDEGSACLIAEAPRMYDALKAIAAMAGADDPAQALALAVAVATVTLEGGQP